MLLRTLLGAVAALLVCTGSAHASSLVYVKDYNVWLANPDGTGARQLTTDGFKELPYESPSQADDGTILAGRGLKFVKLDRQGHQIGPLLPSILVGKPANALAVGPFDPKLSPDGHKLVYWIGTWSTWFDYGTSTTWTDPQDAVIWQDADSGAQLGFTMFYEKPSWLQDSRHALLSQPGNRLAAQIVGSAIGGKPQRRHPCLHRQRLQARRGVLLPGRRRPGAHAGRRQARGAARPERRDDPVLRHAQRPPGRICVRPRGAGRRFGGGPDVGAGRQRRRVGRGRRHLDDAGRGAGLHGLLVGATAPDHRRRVAARLGPRRRHAGGGQGAWVGAAPRGHAPSRARGPGAGEHQARRAAAQRREGQDHGGAGGQGDRRAAARSTCASLAGRGGSRRSGAPCSSSSPSRRQAARVRHARTLKLGVRKGRHAYAQRLALRR